MKQQESGTENISGRRIEWTGTGGGYYLAVVVDEGNDIISECWADRMRIETWMKERWPSLPANYVPMVDSPMTKRKKRSADLAPPKKKLAR